MFGQSAHLLKPNMGREEASMTEYLGRFRKYLSLFSCLLILASCLLVLPIQTMAQTGSTSFAGLLSKRIRRIQVAFSYSPTYPKAGQAVQFTDSSKDSMTSWQWDFGDGMTSTDQNPSHSFSAAGFYRVTLTAGNSSGSKSVKRIISVRPSNEASFTYSPSSPVAGQMVQFTDASPGNPTSWQWHFGDGTTSTTKNASHAYGSAGSYTVTLVASNSSSSMNASKTIAVTAATSLTASFTYSPTLPPAGQAVQFTDTSSGSPTSWQWNFGDGSTSTIQHPTHSFTTAASYTVTLTVANSSGSKATTRTVTVLPGLAASFSYTPTSPVAGQIVQFTDTSSGSPTAWQWSFGDGTTSTVRNPSHAYTTVASYNVNLTVSNSAGLKNTSLTVNVLPSTALVASFTYNPASPAVGQAVQFTDTSTGIPTSWQWDFGDATSSTAQDPSHTYMAAGSYLVTLTIRTGSNLNNTSQTITIKQSNVITAASPSFSDVSAAISSANSGDTVIVPAGSATWSSQLVITKGIRLVGAGVDNTIITSNYTAPNMGNPSDPLNYLIVYKPASPAANEPFRLTGFTIDVAGKCIPLIIENSTITPINKIRIDHNKTLNTMPGRLILVSGTVYGVIDSNEFHGGTLRFYALNEQSWNNLTFDFGTADNMYVEDNVFWLGAEAGVSAGAGSRYCVRHNTYYYTDTTQGLYPWFDAHGNMGTGGNLSTMGCEIYENTITMTPDRGVGLFDLRGGKGIIFNNRANVSGSGGASQKVNEQIDDRLNPPAVSPISGQPQHVSDSYIWNNTKNGTTLIPTDIESTIDYGGTIGIVPQRNRDFWDEDPSFDGTTGIGVGPLASRPTNCIKGVGYWATDTNTLYRCTATNTWEAYYTPYAYPHPLRKLP